MAGVVYYTRAQREFGGVRTRRKVRATKEFQTGFMLPQKFFNVKVSEMSFPGISKEHFQ